jgi:predicted transcriptional regulator
MGIADSRELLANLGMSREQEIARAATAAELAVADSHVKFSVIQERALALLGAGLTQQIVAASLGVSQAAISAMLSEESFSARLAELRYESLAKHNIRDDKADSLETRILEKLEQSLPMIHKPMELTRVYQVINAAKRRGSSVPESIQEKQQIVQLVVPIQLLNKFQVNVQGQAVTVSHGEDVQDLVTIQSNALDGILREKEQAVIQGRVKELLDGNGKGDGNGQTAIAVRTAGA